MNCTKRRAIIKLHKVNGYLSHQSGRSYRLAQRLIENALAEVVLSRNSDGRHVRDAVNRNSSSNFRTVFTYWRTRPVREDFSNPQFAIDFVNGRDIQGSDLLLGVPVR